MVDIEGVELSDEDRDLLTHPAVGGVILFTRNFESVDQLRALVNAIHMVRAPALLIGIDQEGGRVQRLRGAFTPLPPISIFGDLYNNDENAALDLARECAWLMAAELRAVGIDFSFAPVLDLRSEQSEVINDRAFDSRPHVVSKLAHAYMAGMDAAGMAAVGKHFPGHGMVKGDSHHVLPRDGRDPQTISENDLVPFKSAIRKGLRAIMMAHVVYPRCAPEPAGYSKHWIQTVLRERLQFDGAVFSDDLTMAGAAGAGDFRERAKRSLTCGCDMVLICNNRAGVIEVVSDLDHWNQALAQVRLMRLRGGALGESFSDLRNSRRWRAINGRLREVFPDPQLDLQG
ncbi:MAG: beta-N-acetylhexosaminidase [Pseudomonadota bacterium]